nr:hypothetical protein [Tanacetum cinerariifolium]
SIMIEEPMKLKKKDQIMFDEEVALKLQAELQAEFDKKQRLASDQLTERLQAEEQQELNDVEKATLFMQLLEKRRKLFAAKRAEEKRNKPPTRAQQRSIMYAYLKNMEGWKPNSLKNMSFANIQELFDKAIKRVNTFVDYRTELVEESSKKVKAKVMEGSLKRAGIKLEQKSSKRAGTELEQESSKKQKIDDDKETTELNNSQMQNNIMASGSRDHPPMLATRRYPQWRSRFLRYINTRPNGDALRKCILSGPYKPTTVLVQAVDATDDFLAILEHTIVETPMNM